MTKVDKIRQGLYSVLQVGKAQISLDEDEYRAILQQHGAKQRNGRYSASTMSIAQLEAVKAHLAACGAQFSHKPKTKAAAPKGRLCNQAEYVVKLYNNLVEKGVIRNPTQTTLNKLVERWTGIARLEWVSEHRHFQAMIAALKQMDK